ncbi:MAG: NUDIX domain-containing protein [Cytophagaceae bacterium]
MNYAVIIARFQSPYLHQGHIHLIEEIKKEFAKVIIVLGVSPLPISRKNPFDYTTREKMIKSMYPDMVVLPLSDHPSDTKWSANLDQLLKSTFPNSQFTLFGSRDSFIQLYNGKLTTKELPAHGDYNSTEIRKQYAERAIESEDFRAGILYAVHSMYKKVYPTVDVAVFRNNRTEILLGMKAINKKWRFIGGFVDPEDNNYEEAAKRELMEEAGNIEVGPMQYEMSLRIEDWRYGNESDKIISTVYSCDFLFGAPSGQDDIMQVKWFHVSELESLLNQNETSPEHQKIFQHVIKKYTIK